LSGAIEGVRLFHGGMPEGANELRELKRMPEACRNSLQFARFVGPSGSSGFFVSFVYFVDREALSGSVSAPHGALISNSRVSRSESFLIGQMDVPRR
jgi:hypothetical protein